MCFFKKVTNQLSPLSRAFCHVLIFFLDKLFILFYYIKVLINKYLIQYFLLLNNNYNMSKKYILTNKASFVDGAVVYQIQAIRDISNDVKKGDLGGYVESEANLGHDNHSWIYDHAKVYGNAKVHENGIVCGGARVYGNAKISEWARVSDNVKISGSVEITGNAKISQFAEISGTAKISGYTEISGNAKIN